jgi:hypothetical protein
MTPLGSAALRLAERGFRVFPCRERAKEPLIKNNLQKATTDPRVIAGWWSAKNYNIGFATGSLSGLWVLDVDGDEGEAALRKLEAEHGALPTTVEAVTGKGRHLYFRWPHGRIISSRTAILPGVDTRANGGYVLTPPSVHPSGKVYTWSVDSAAEFEDAPEWLLDLVVRGGGNNGGQPISPEAWLAFLKTPVEGSRREAAITKLTGKLLWLGMDAQQAHELVQCWNLAGCKPPLNADEVTRRVDLICGRELARRTVK